MKKYNITNLILLLHLGLSSVGDALEVKSSLPRNVRRLSSQNPNLLRNKKRNKKASSYSIDDMVEQDKSVASTGGTSTKHSINLARGGEEGELSRFTKVRRTIFPIHGKEEVKKFLLIGSIKFFIILALTLTRDTKDTLVVTQCGAEAIAFLKVRKTRELMIYFLIYASRRNSPIPCTYISGFTLLCRSTACCQPRPHLLHFTPKWRPCWKRKRCFTQHASHSLFSSSCSTF